MNMEEFNRSLADLKKHRTIKECFHHKKDECKGKIKNAHSIQENGKLSILENEVNKNMSLYTFTKFISSENNVIEELIPLGKGESSTFFGFCDYHDTNLFSDIENNKFEFDNPKHLFLHSYRSFAHSYHKKREEYKLYDNIEKSKLKNTVSKFQKQIFQFGNKIAMSELNKSKEYLDNALENKNWDSLQYLVYEKKGLFPIAVSSQLCPLVSYRNIPINNHLEFHIPFENLMLTMLPDFESTVAIIASFPNQKKAVKLIEELDSLNDLQLEYAITSLIISNCENTFFSPFFWHSLSKKEKRRILDEFIANENLQYRNKFFKSSFNFFDEKYELTKLKRKYS